MGKNDFETLCNFKELGIAKRAHISTCPFARVIEGKSTKRLFGESPFYVACAPVGVSGVPMFSRYKLTPPRCNQQVSCE
jgi:hypothetical protein